MKKTVLMLQNNMQPPGGANTVALWMLDAIKSEFDVTVLTWDRVDLDKINDFYGTSLQPEDFKVITIPGWIRKAVDLVPDPWLWQRYSVLMRKCRQIGHHYQLLLSAHDETDFGRAGVQYVHYPFQAANWALEKKRLNSNHLTDRVKLFFSVRLRPWRIISGYSFDRMLKNSTLVNSNWTGIRFQDAYGTSKPETVYPPIIGAFEPHDWDRKEEGFVCIGRFAEDKRIDRVIEIIARVREHHPEVRLHLVGTYSPRDDEDAYYRKVKEIARRHGDWIQLHENISRQELIDLVCRQRYGIHGKIQEHFGLAVAEMVAAGCLPFVPNDGGQVEIVGCRKELIFDSDEQAIIRILAIMKDSELQRELREFLRDRKSLFSLKTFQEHVRRILNSQPCEPVSP